jgi:hypothetical protein
MSFRLAASPAWNLCWARSDEIGGAAIFRLDSCKAVGRVYLGLGKESRMKTKIEKPMEQPKPFTPGITMAMVRQHAYELFCDKLPDHPLTLSDWVLAEKDLVTSLETEPAQS